MLALLVLAALIGALWWSRREPAANSSSTSAGSATPSRTSTRTSEPGLPTDADATTTTAPPPSTDDAARTAPPVEPQLNPPAIQARMAEVHARLQELLHPCLATVSSAHPSPTAEFRFSYRLTFAKNEATVSDVKLVWSEVESSDLEKCLLGKAAAAHWKQEEPDGSTTVEDAFQVKDLKDVK